MKNDSFILELLGQKPQSDNIGACFYYSKNEEALAVVCDAIAASPQQIDAETIIGMFLEPAKLCELKQQLPDNDVRNRLSAFIDSLPTVSDRIDEGKLRSDYATLIGRLALKGRLI